MREAHKAGKCWSESLSNSCRIQEHPTRCALLQLAVGAEPCLCSEVFWGKGMSDDLCDGQPLFWAGFQHPLHEQSQCWC